MCVCARSPPYLIREGKLAIQFIEQPLSLRVIGSDRFCQIKVWVFLGSSFGPHLSNFGPFGFRAFVYTMVHSSLLADIMPNFILVQIYLRDLHWAQWCLGLGYQFLHQQIIWLLINRECSQPPKQGGRAGSMLATLVRCWNFKDTCKMQNEYNSALINLYREEINLTNIIRHAQNILKN